MDELDTLPDGDYKDGLVWESREDRRNELGMTRRAFDLLEKLEEYRNSRRWEDLSPDQKIITKGISTLDGAPNVVEQVVTLHWIQRMNLAQSWGVPNNSTPTKRKITKTTYPDGRVFKREKYLYD